MPTNRSVPMLVLDRFERVGCGIFVMYLLLLVVWFECYCLIVELLNWCISVLRRCTLHMICGSVLDVLIIVPFWLSSFGCQVELPTLPPHFIAFHLV